MKTESLAWLRCPLCRSPLSLHVAQTDALGIREGSLNCPACSRDYPVVEHLPRFVSSENYAASFGLQWSRFAHTQLDSFSGTTITRDRFIAQTGWGPESLRGKRVLDAGCGSGRFAEVALALGAEVVAVDYSAAVDSCWKYLGHHPKLHVIQADIYALPFEPGGFDAVYSLGVLQHTPRVFEALKALAPQVKPGGRVIVDVYLKSWRRVLHSKFWLRPIFRGMRPERLFRLVEATVPGLFRLSRASSSIPLVGPLVRRLLPVADYEGVYPLSDAQSLEWMMLDTFDWLSPRYDQPQTPATLAKWLHAVGLEEVEVFLKHHLTGRGTRPRRPC